MRLKRITVPALPVQYTHPFWHRECVAGFRMSITLMKLWLCALPLADPSTGEIEALQSALTAVEGHLGKNETGEEWRELVMFDELRSACSEADTDSEVLSTAIRRLAQKGAKGKPDAVVRLQCELERVLVSKSLPEKQITNLSGVAASILSRSQNTATRQTLRHRLVALIGSLACYTDSPADHLAHSISHQLDELSEHREAAPLVAAVRTHYGHPNLWIDISADLLDDSIRGEIDRWDVIDTVIMDTPIKGKGRVRALRELVVEPRPDAAVLKIVIEGSIDSQTVGRRGPALIKSHALTSFRAEKPLVLTAEGLTVLPTVCEAETETLDSEITSQKAGLRGWIVRRVGERRSKKLRVAADHESSLHAQKRLLASIDREAETLVKRLDRLAILPLSLLSAFTGGNPLTICCERRVLRIGATVGGLGAPPVRPDCDDRQLFTIRLHESLVQRRSAAAPRSLSAPLAWQIALRTLQPRLTVAGVTLREGNWGTVLPVGFGEWLALEWRPPLSQPHLAEAPSALER